MAEKKNECKRTLTLDFELQDLPDMPRFRMEPRDAREHLRSIQHPALRYVKRSVKQRSVKQVR